MKSCREMTDGEAAADALRSLMKTAFQQVPRPLKAGTPLVLMATAGMRLLSDANKQAVLQRVRDMLDETGFAFQRDQARIIAGWEEAVYDWMSMNLLGQHLDGANRKPQRSGEGLTQVAKLAKALIVQHLRSSCTELSDMRLALSAKVERLAVIMRGSSDEAELPAAVEACKDSVNDLVAAWENHLTSLQESMDDGSVVAAAGEIAAVIQEANELRKLLSKLLSAMRKTSSKASSFRASIESNVGRFKNIAANLAFSRSIGYGRA